MNSRSVVSSPSRARNFDTGRGDGTYGRLLLSNRFSLGGAIFLAVVLPEFLHPYVEKWGPWFGGHTSGLEPSALSAMAAIVATHLSLRRMGSLPLVTTRSLIFPTVMICFGGALLGLLALKIPPSRYHIWVAPLVTYLWYLWVSVLRARIVRPVIGLFAIRPESLADLPGNIDWREFDFDSNPRLFSAIVIDPHSQFDIKSSQLITNLVLKGHAVYHWTHLEEGLTGRVRFATQADNDFGALLPSLSYVRMRRFIDFIVAMIVWPIFLLIVALAAVAIKLDGPGPVFFRQQRKGFRGDRFTCYKMRTMQDSADGPAFTLEADPRVTRVGKVLRKWRIDELPQILNVVKGEMGWVGPRPEAVELANLYAAQIPFYDYRHAVRPGITGWAAVHQGNVAEESAARMKLEYDFYYIKYFSPWLDILLCFKTLQTILSGFGSR